MSTPIAAVAAATVPGDDVPAEVRTAILAAFPAFNTVVTHQRFGAEVHNGAGFVMSCLCRDELSAEAAAGTAAGCATHLLAKTPAIKQQIEHVQRCTDNAHAKARAQDSKSAAAAVVAADSEDGDAKALDAGVFEFGSLAGLCTCGKTAYGAASHHVPDAAHMRGLDVVVVGGPHIAHCVDHTVADATTKAPKQSWGLMYRDHIAHASSACGAVEGYLNSLRARAKLLAPPAPAPAPFRQTVDQLPAATGATPRTVPLASASDPEMNELMRVVDQQVLSASLLGANDMAALRTALGAITDAPHDTTKSGLMRDLTVCVQTACEQRLQLVGDEIDAILNVVEGVRKPPAAQRPLRVMDCVVVHWNTYHGADNSRNRIDTYVAFRTRRFASTPKPHSAEQHFFKHHDLHQHMQRQQQHRPPSPHLRVDTSDTPRAKPKPNTTSTEGSAAGEASGWFSGQTKVALAVTLGVAAAGALGWAIGSGVFAAKPKGK